MAGVTEFAVWNYELGLRAPRPQHLEALARALGVDPAALTDYRVETAHDALEVLFRLEEGFGARSEADTAGARVVSTPSRPVPRSSTRRSGRGCRSARGGIRGRSPTRSASTGSAGSAGKRIEERGCMGLSQSAKLSILNKDSISIATGIVAVTETALAVSGVSLHDVIPGQAWWAYLLIMLAVFTVLVVSIHFVLARLYRERIELEINGNQVEIVEGDLFAQDGKKVIPFNEYFDSIVNDIIISRSSLNGAFIDCYVDDLDELRGAIEDDNSSPLPVDVYKGRRRYDLGTIKRFGEDYLLLAFSHFDGYNQAHLTMAEYERCLMNMWQELCRVYAGRSISLPLLGSGITRFSDVQRKSEGELLKCMLCTLSSTGQSFSKPINIVLTSEAMSRVDLYEMKGVSRYGL
ncbi:macro domain-containing protein [Parolsenella catena]|uniref:macro domain-containing protein n=1 Tax=Parolsenella catena TaxID=2003188 RepID=UPI003AF1BFC5